MKRREKKLSVMDWVLVGLLDTLAGVVAGGLMAIWQLPSAYRWRGYAGKGVELCKDSPRSIYAVCDPQRQLYGRPCSTWATMGRYTKCCPEID